MLLTLRIRKSYSLLLVCAALFAAAGCSPESDPDRGGTSGGHAGIFPHGAPLAVGPVVPGEGVEIGDGLCQVNGHTYALNERGYVSDATYDASGRLTMFDGLAIRYRDGDPVAIGGHITVDYGDSPVANVGGLMFWSELLDSDTDIADVLYYAGVLGRPCAHLPMLVSVDRGDLSLDVQKTMEWEYGADGRPVRLTVVAGTMGSGDVTRTDYAIVWPSGK